MVTQHDTAISISHPTLHTTPHHTTHTHTHTHTHRVGPKREPVVGEQVSSGTSGTNLSLSVAAQGNAWQPTAKVQRRAVLKKIVKTNRFAEHFVDT